MSIEKIKRLRDAQFAAVRKQWWCRDHSTNPVSRDVSSKAVRNIYTLLEKPCPDIIYCRGPSEAVTRLSQARPSVPIPLHGLIQVLRDELPRQRGLSEDPICRNQRRKLASIRYSIAIRTSDPLYLKYSRVFSDAFSLHKFTGYLSSIDFCVSFLKTKHSEEIWLPIKALALHTDYAFLFEDYCYVSDRPLIVRLDKIGLPHALEEPAVVYKDKFSIHFYKGRWLSSVYGKLPTTQWKTEWLFQTSEQSFRQILVDGIGLERISSELILEKKDSWDCYDLYVVENPKPLHQRFKLLVKKHSCGNDDLVIINDSAPPGRQSHEQLAHNEFFR